MAEELKSWTGGGGFKYEILDDGRIRVTHPDGRVVQVSDKSKHYAAILKERDEYGDFAKPKEAEPEENPFANYQEQGPPLEGEAAYRVSPAGQAVSGDLPTGDDLRESHKPDWSRKNQSELFRAERSAPLDWGRSNMSATPKGDTVAEWLDQYLPKLLKKIEPESQGSAE